MSHLDKFDPLFFVKYVQFFNANTNQATLQRQLAISKYNVQLEFEISSYIQFYCFLTCSYNR